MKKFNVKFQRDFEVEIKADSLQIAEGLAYQIVAQFPPETTKLLSVIAEGSEQVEEPTPPRPWGRPNGGGTPGTPVIKQEVLEDQIARAA